MLIMSNKPDSGAFFQGMRELLFQAQTVLMATSDADGLPEISYSPHVLHDGYLYVYLSDLSVHTGNLKVNPRVSLLFIEDEREAENLHARRRATFTATATIVDRDQSDYAQVLDRMEGRFGEVVGILKSLPDFHLFRMTPGQVSVVLGFAQARVLDCVAFPESPAC